MYRLLTKSLTGLLLAVLFQPASAIVIDLKSGNGSVGGTDSQISMLLGPANSGFASAFTTADFAAARAGSAASIINPHGAWLPTSSFNGDTSAQWISTSSTGASEGGTALYAIDFNLAVGSILAGTLDFYWSADNLLGIGPNPGVFLNGTAVPASFAGGFGLNAPVLGLNVASLLNTGLNTLYINSVDVGGPGGLLFSASIDVTGGPVVGGAVGVPEPAPLALMTLGLLAIGLLRKRKLSA